MWFLLGLLCGGVVWGAVILCLPTEKDTPRRELPAAKSPRKAWGETRNFLYYDGTMMPEIKEDSDE